MEGPIVLPMEEYNLVLFKEGNCENVFKFSNLSQSRYYPKWVLNSFLNLFLSLYICYVSGPNLKATLKFHADTKVVFVFLAYFGFFYSAKSNLLTLSNIIKLTLLITSSF